MRFTEQSVKHRIHLGNAQDESIEVHTVQ